MLKPLTVCITTNCGKFLDKWEYQITLPVSWETCLQDKKQHLEPDMEQQTGSKLAKEYVMAVYCHPAYLTSMQRTMWNAGLDEAGIKIARRNINNIRYAYDTTLVAENEEELKSLLMKVKEESEKAGLKLNIQKMKIMASGPITSWQIDGEKCGNRNKFHFNFLGLQNTAVMKLKDACSLEKSYDKPRQCIKKQRHHFADKGPSIQSYGFPNSHVQMWVLDYKEGWALKN